MNNTLAYNKARILQLWLLLSVPYLLLFFYMNSFVATDNVYYNSFAARLSIDRINEMITRQRSFLWISYLLIPVMLYIKVILTAGCLFTRVYLVRSDISFRKVVKLAFLSETVFVLSGVVRVILLSFIFRPNTLKELQAFSPLSLLSLLNTDHLPLYLFYPLQVLNLFELCYWILLGVGLADTLKISFPKAFGYVLSSYVPALLVWVLIVMFIQLQFLP